MSPGRYGTIVLVTNGSQSTQLTTKNRVPSDPLYRVREKRLIGRLILPPEPYRVAISLPIER